jgi:sn-glycerol 3-phosphate transport system substrate-binding protein
MTRRSFPLVSVCVAVCVAVSLAASACGGSSKPVASPSTSPTATPTTLAAGASSTAVASTTSSSVAPGPTTTAIPAEKLAPCDVGALAKATAPVEITFWHGMTAENEKMLARLVETYNGQQTKVKVNLVSQVNYETTVDKFAKASKADRPDVVQLADYSFQLVSDSKTIVPAQSCVNAEKFDTSDYLAGALAYFTSGGALQAVPFNISTPVLFYDRKAFARAGLDPNQPPKTLDELAVVAKKIKESGASTYGVALDTGFDSGGGWVFEQFRAKAGVLFADNENGRQARATKVVWNDDAQVKALTLLQAMVKDGTAINVGTADKSENLLKLADQKDPAAMTVNSSAAIGSVLAVLKSGSFPGFAPEDLGIGPMPMPPGPGGQLIGGAGLYIAKDKGDDKTAAAWDFIKFLTSVDSQRAWSAATGYVSVRKSAPPEGLTKVAFDVLNSGTVTNATAGPALGPHRQIRQASAKAVQTIYDGADVKATLATAEQEHNALLADYNKRVSA